MTAYSGMCSKMAPDSRERKLRWRSWGMVERIIKNKKQIALFVKW